MLTAAVCPEGSPSTQQEYTYIGIGITHASRGRRAESPAMLQSPAVGFKSMM